MPLSFLPRSAGVVAASLAVLAATGCSSEMLDCPRGDEFPEVALRAFLDAAQRDDLGDMRSQVFPILEVTSADLALVAKDLEGVEVSELVLHWSEPVHGRHIYRATTADDRLVGEWEVGEMEEPHLGCWAVAWGELKSDSPDPTPSSKVGPTP